MDKMKVYFNGSFWGHHGRDHAGKEIQINQTFDWAGHRWFIPAAYSCGKGLVIDFCMQAASEAIQNFIKKWNLSPENDSCTFFTEEQQMQMERECETFSVKLTTIRSFYDKINIIRRAFYYGKTKETGSQS